MSVGFGVGAIIDRLFSSRRLGEWKKDATLRTCADDLAAYLTEKGWIVVDERRRVISKYKHILLLVEDNIF